MLNNILYYAIIMCFGQQRRSGKVRKECVTQRSSKKINAALMSLPYLTLNHIVNISVLFDKKLLYQHYSSKLIAMKEIYRSSR